MANTEIKPRKNRSEAKPFYLPSGPTSAEIVAEARTSVRCVDTKRPCTPVESQRTLFGGSRRPESHSRPPSAFSIGPRHFVEPDLPSPTTLTNRLQPLANAPDAPDGPLYKPDEDHVVVQIERKVKQSVRLSKSVDPLQPLDFHSSDNGGLLPSPPKPVRPHDVASRRGSTGNIAKQKLGDNIHDTRRAHSGPIKRTSPRDVSDNNRAKSSPTTGRLSNETLNKKGANEKDALALETKKLSRLYKELVRPVLKEMDDNLQQEDANLLCENCQRLLNKLKKVGILPETKVVEGSSFKVQILKCLFSYLAIKDSHLHLRLAKIVLMFNLSENNEENIFKLMFKVSRDENNDLMFLEEQVTDLLIDKVSKFDGSGKYEAWIYCVGALKLLSGNSAIRKNIVTSGCVEALGVVLSTIVKQNSSEVKLKKNNTNLLLPVTAVLRNLADVNGSRDVFLKRNLLPELMAILKIFKTDSDVVMNICRILSKMTLYDECCIAVSSVTFCFETFLRVLGIHLKSQEIVVRVLFILGNLTTKSDETRHNLYFTKASTKYLLMVFQSFFERNIQASKTGEDNNEASAEQENTEDVLNKMVRVIANLSIHPEVGPDIAKNMEIIELLVQVLEVKDFTTSEELVLNTIATINNLSYYAEENTALAVKRSTVTQLLMGMLVADNMDAILEVSRVFGNFSRFKDVRDILSSHKVDEMMISLLDSGSHEIVYTACGVLINLMVDPEKRSVLKEEGGIKKLIDVLRDFGKIDWQLAAMVCQTLWNYGESTCNVYEAFGEEETIVLTDLLREYLDEETAFDYVSSRKIDPSVQTLLRETWKENFELVGEHLLQKIESKESDLVPLEEPS
ncbi:armadillo repeat-containing protein 2-like [Dendronephthya gigantea]|uniref:armadillo repeat-containing protein 2-like n=1 Tax=Dendronephthya gigantea TaxID=151771 RepID=UPI00106B74CA|nr:armadillo repeat-containing protein 2-like [Dendronephthya gigantea]